LTECRFTGSARGKIERLPPGGTVEVRLDAEQSPVVHGREPPTERLRKALERPASNELRLTAQASGELEGFALSPQPSQVNRMTFVVAHLEYDDGPPRVDVAGRSQAARRRALE
jgi:hypothetical protein